MNMRPTASKIITIFKNISFFCLFLIVLPTLTYALPNHKDVNPDYYKHDGIVYSIAFSPDGKYLVSAGEDHSIRVWNSYSGEPVKVLKSHAGPVKAVDWSNDGKYIASGSVDRTVKLWDFKNDEPPRVLEKNAYETDCIRFTPDSLKIITISHSDVYRDSYLKIIDVETANVYFREKLPYEKNYLSDTIECSYCFEGGIDTLFATTKKNGPILIWSLRNKKSIEEIKLSGPPISMYGSGSIMAGVLNASKMWSTSHFSHKDQYVNQLWEDNYYTRNDNSDDSYSKMLYLANEKLDKIISVDNDPNILTIRIFYDPDDDSTYELQHKIPFDSDVTDIQINPDISQRMIATSHYDGSIRFWNIDEGELIFEIKPISKATNNSDKVVISINSDDDDIVFDSSNNDNNSTEDEEPSSAIVEDTLKTHEDNSIDEGELLTDDNSNILDVLISDLSFNNKTSDTKYISTGDIGEISFTLVNNGSTTTDKKTYAELEINGQKLGLEYIQTEFIGAINPGDSISHKFDIEATKHLEDDTVEVRIRVNSGSQTAFSDIIDIETRYRMPVIEIEDTRITSENGNDLVFNNGEIGSLTLNVVNRGNKATCEGLRAELDFTNDIERYISSTPPSKESIALGVIDGNNGMKSISWTLRADAYDLTDMTGIATVNILGCPDVETASANNKLYTQKYITSIIIENPKLLNENGDELRVLYGGEKTYLEFTISNNEKKPSCSQLVGNVSLIRIAQQDSQSIIKDMLKCDNCSDIPIGVVKNGEPKKQTLTIIADEALRDGIVSARVNFTGCEGINENIFQEFATFETMRTEEPMITLKSIKFKNNIGEEIFEPFHVFPGDQIIVDLSFSNEAGGPAKNVASQLLINPQEQEGILVDGLIQEYEREKFEAGSEPWSLKYTISFNKKIKDGDKSSFKIKLYDNKKNREYFVTNTYELNIMNPDYIFDIVSDYRYHEASEKQYGIAIIIGNHQYRDDTWNVGAKPALASAKLMKDVAINVWRYNEEYIIENFGSDSDLNDIITIADFKKLFEVEAITEKTSDSTDNLIVNRFQEAKRRRDKESPDSPLNVFFYYSGHGEKIDDSSVLIPYDAPKVIDKYYGYPSSNIYKFLQSLDADKVLVMWEACQSGADLNTFGKSIQNGVSLDLNNQGSRLTNTVKNSAIIICGKEDCLWKKYERGGDIFGPGEFTFAFVDTLINIAEKKQGSGVVNLKDIFGEMITDDGLPSVKENHDYIQTPEIFPRDRDIEILKFEAN